MQNKSDTQLHFYIKKYYQELKNVRIDGYNVMKDSKENNVLFVNAIS